jgi:schlafen family protein
MLTGAVKAASTESLFRDLRVPDILELVSVSRREDLTLDFKLAPRNFDNRDERRVLAEAISGFANAAGGLIVWGIDARVDTDGVDCARNAIPLGQPELFMSRLVSYSASAASPVVNGVEHRLVEGLGGPFALTYVPESDSGPHMAKLGEDRYFKRSGDRFVRMEHFDIADMFGRRRRPALKLSLEKQDNGETILVTIRNEGRGIAKAPYLALKMPSEFSLSAYGFDGNGAFGLAPVGRNYETCFLGGDANRVIHVGQTLVVAKLEVRTRHSHGISQVAAGAYPFRYELAAEDCEISTGEIVLNY